MERLLTFKRRWLKLTIKMNRKLLSWVSKEDFCIEWVKEIITEEICKFSGSLERTVNKRLS